MLIVFCIHYSANTCVKNMSQVTQVFPSELFSSSWFLSPCQVANSYCIYSTLGITVSFFLFCLLRMQLNIHNVETKSTYSHLENYFVVKPHAKCLLYSFQVSTCSHVQMSLLYWDDWCYGSIVILTYAFDFFNKWAVWRSITCVCPECLFMACHIF